MSKSRKSSKELKPENVTAIVVYSDIQQTGFFETANYLFDYATFSQKY